MVRIERLAEAALAGEALALRSLAQDWIHENPRPAELPRPESNDPSILAVAASLVELFSERMGQPAPPWTSQIGRMPQPLYLLKAALTMKRLRHLCEVESPPSLRRRNLYAPADYLRFA